VCGEATLTKTGLVTLGTFSPLGINMPNLKMFLCSVQFHDLASECIIIVVIVRWNKLEFKI
jgi:hypothetical protein